MPPSISPPSRWLPLTGVVIFFVAGIVFRCVLHRRRHGTWGFALFHTREAGRLARDAMAVLLALLLLGESLIVALRPGVLEPLYVFEPQRGIGLLLMLGGVILIVVAQEQMGASWRIGIEDEARVPLVTRGVYRYSRNPIFVAMLVSIGGFALLVPTRLSIILFLATIAGIRRQVISEERYLVARHGDAYRQYARAVGRFLPWWGRYR